ncbi:MAG TPA: hypothetical protein ENI31_00095, partial [Candidatus Omnitrophica bacterium]|nr:hypothetical protein [Candidatus Omnitrophota bacterium]
MIIKFAAHIRREREFVELSKKNKLVKPINSTEEWEKVKKVFEDNFKSLFSRPVISTHNIPKSQRTAVEGYKTEAERVLNKVNKVSSSVTKLIYRLGILTGGEVAPGHNALSINTDILDGYSSIFASSPIIEKKLFDYISILAGGRCKMNCHFCVGKSIREKKKPSFADKDKVLWFINFYSQYTKLFSISGSTSDPMLTNLDLLNLYIKEGKDKGLRVSLHTHSNTIPLILENIDKILLCDKIVLSVHDLKNVDSVNELIGKFKKGRIRISSVCHSGNKSLLESKKFYESFGSNQFTIRLNIFEPDLKIRLPYPFLNKFIFGQPCYGDEEKTIAVWNFKEANKIIEAMYLWPNGEIQPQCYWKRLHPSCIIEEERGSSPLNKEGVRSQHLTEGRENSSSPMDLVSFSTPGVEKDRLNKKKKLNHLQLEYPARLEEPYEKPTPKQKRIFYNYYLKNSFERFDLAINPKELVVLVRKTKTDKLADIVTVPQKIAILESLIARSPPSDSEKSQIFQTLINDIILHETSYLIKGLNEKGAQLESLRFFRANPSSLIEYLKAVEIFGVRLDREYRLSLSLHFAPLIRSFKIESSISLTSSPVKEDKELPTSLFSLGEYVDFIEKLIELLGSSDESHRRWAETTLEISMQNPQFKNYILLKHFKKLIELLLFKKEPIILKSLFKFKDLNEDVHREFVINNISIIEKLIDKMIDLNREEFLAPEEKEIFEGIKSYFLLCAEYIPSKLVTFENFKKLVKEERFSEYLYSFCIKLLRLNPQTINSKILELLFNEAIKEHNPWRVVLLIRLIELRSEIVSSDFVKKMIEETAKTFPELIKGRAEKIVQEGYEIIKEKKEIDSLPESRKKKPTFIFHSSPRYFEELINLLSLLVSLYPEEVKKAKQTKE